MLTEAFYDSFYKKLVDKLLYNNYTQVDFVGKNYANLKTIKLEIIQVMNKINDDKQTTMV
jgi:hypothetical protein